MSTVKFLINEIGFLRDKTRTPASEGAVACQGAS